MCKATIFKAGLQIADLDRHYYGDHALTLARHPSETDERMMVRILAFALNADERLKFSKGLCVDDEPDLWRKDLTDDIELWIDLGQPDEKRIRKACARAERVTIYAYQPRAARIWWSQVAADLAPRADVESGERPVEEEEARPLGSSDIGVVVTPFLQAA